MQMWLPIVRGPLRGTRWSITSRGKLLRVLTGGYEREHTRAFVEVVRAGDTVLDIGAHAGYYALLAARLVGPGGGVWAFEPDPGNFRSLKTHVRLNRLDHIRALSMAVADAPGHGRFAAGSGSGTGRLDDFGDLNVEKTSLDAFCPAAGLEPNVIKIDVEGAESRVLAGATETLTRYRPILLISTHGRAQHLGCLDRLAALQYRAVPIGPAALETATEILAVPSAPPHSI